jgi:hypothetical protein
LLPIRLMIKTLPAKLCCLFLRQKWLERACPWSWILYNEQVVNRAMLVVLGAQSFLSLLSSILPLVWKSVCLKMGDCPPSYCHQIIGETSF